MKILVFGATGATGSLVVEQALANGHSVTAFVRNPSKIQWNHSHLRIVQGDVLNKETIDRAMPGHEAVICCIGAPATKAGESRSAGTKNILLSMQQAGVCRLICLASLGYDDSEAVLANTPFIFRKVIVPLLLKKTFAEHSKQEKEIRESSIDWTIVRPGTMTNKAFTGNYNYGVDYKNNTWKVKVSRADVAHFMLGQLNNRAYLQKAVGISY